MQRYILCKYVYDLTDEDKRLFVQERYKNYYTQRIEGKSCCLSYLGGNLIFAKKVGKKMLIVSVFAPNETIRNFWCSFPLQKLSRKTFDLFYNRKYILL